MCSEFLIDVISFVYLNEGEDHFVVNNSNLTPPGYFEFIEPIDKVRKSFGEPKKVNKIVFSCFSQRFRETTDKNMFV